MTIMTFIEVKGQQKSNVVIYVIWLPHLVRYTQEIYRLYKLRMVMMTFMDVKGHPKVIKG